MEVLISIAIGVILIELYVWLDPLSKFLVRWAAKKLPAGRDEEFQAQWEADLASVPNSLFKLYFVLRDCVLPISDIQQMMFREELADIADRFDELVARQSRFDGILDQTTDLVASAELTEIRLISTMDRVLERLRLLGSDVDSLAAIDRCLVLKPALAGRFSDYAALLKDDHSVLLEATGVVRDTFGRLERAQLNIRNRVLDPRPIEDADGDLLDELIAATERLSEAMDGVHDAFARWRDVPADLMPTTRETCEAFKAAISLVHTASGGGHARTA
jgi:hypothetical protein